MAKMVEALFWEPREGGTVACKLCPVRCVLKEGKTGVCMAKKNIGGTLYAVAYGRTTAFNYDPVEKKPLYHFHPGAAILSLGPNACNMGCQFCQNFQISQEAAPTQFVAPDQLVAAANLKNCVGVAYTYTEPLMWYEYVRDAAHAVRRAGLKNVLVSNGYLEPEPYDAILPLIDALNVDIKSMDEEFYRKICKGKLAPVLRNVSATVGKAHIEITNLVIPGLNDSDGNFERLAKFMGDLDPYMPLHFSRYHPMYKMENPMTPVDALLRAREIARKHLKFVYIGNVDVDGASDTHCPACNALLVSRHGYSTEVAGVENGNCRKCGEPARIVGL